MKLRVKLYLHIVRISLNYLSQNIFEVTVCIAAIGNLSAIWNTFCNHYTQWTSSNIASNLQRDVQNNLLNKSVFNSSRRWLNTLHFELRTSWLSAVAKQANNIAFNVTLALCTYDLPVTRQNKSADAAARCSLIKVYYVNRTEIGDFIYPSYSGLRRDVWHRFSRVIRRIPETQPPWQWWICAWIGGNSEFQLYSFGVLFWRRGSRR